MRRPRGNRRGENKRLLTNRGLCGRRKPLQETGRRAPDDQEFLHHFERGGGGFSRGATQIQSSRGSSARPKSVPWARGGNSSKTCEGGKGESTRAPFPESHRLGLSCSVGKNHIERARSGFLSDGSSTKLIQRGQKTKEVERIGVKGGVTCRLSRHTSRLPRLET